MIGSDEELGVFLSCAESSDHVEEADDIGGDVLVAGEEAEVGVELCGCGVIVSGAEVCVGADSPFAVDFFFSCDHGAFGMCFESEYAVGDMDAGRFELAGEGDILFFIESCPEFNEAGDLFAVLGGADE